MVVYNYNKQLAIPVLFKAYLISINFYFPTNPSFSIKSCSDFNFYLAWSVKS